MSDAYDAIAAEIAAELRRARTKHAPMRGAHEGYAVLLEEVDELWDEVKRRDPRDPDRAAMRKEAIQIAAMGMAFALEVASPSPAPEEAPRPCVYCRAMHGKHDPAADCPCDGLATLREDLASR